MINYWWFWYPVKVLYITHNFFAGTTSLSLSVYEPIAIRVLWGTVPQLGEGVEQEGRVRYHVNVLHIRHNLFAGTETLSLFVYEPIVICAMWGAFLHLGEGVK